MPIVMESYNQNASLGHQGKPNTQAHAFAHKHSQVYRQRSQELKGLNKINKTIQSEKKEFSFDWIIMQS